MKIYNFRNLTHVELLAYVDLKRATAISHGHVTCGNVSISSAEQFSMYALNKMQTQHTPYVRKLLIA